MGSFLEPGIALEKTTETQAAIDLVMAGSYTDTSFRSPSNSWPLFLLTVVDLFLTLPHCAVFFPGFLLP